MAERGSIALVTGASGFVGSHLVEHLARNGITVRALLRGSSSQRWLPVQDLVEVHRAPLNDSVALRELLEGVTTVFHLAAVTSAPRHADYFSANVEGTRSIVAATKEIAPDAAFVLCSSQAAAGPSREGRPLTEKDPPRPEGPYGRSKLEAERVLLDSGLRATVVRPPTVYGPRDTDILEMFRWASRGFAPLIGRHQQKLSLVYVSDLVAALVAASEEPRGATYFVTDGHVHTRDELMSTIASAVAREIRRVHVPVSLAMTFAHVSRMAARFVRMKPLLTPERIRDFCELNWTCDDTLARNELGYVSEVPVQQGMIQTVKWYRKQGWI
jgi:nucleoside-diphosphate-sugar epimerase